LYVDASSVSVVTGIRKESSTTPLLKAAAEGHTEVVRVLLKHGADIEARCKVQYSHGIYHSPYPTTTADHIHPFHV
jgi:ankyrin repeat protein